MPKRRKDSRYLKNRKDSRCLKEEKIADTKQKKK